MAMQELVEDVFPESASYFFLQLYDKDWQSYIDLSPGDSTR